MTHNYSFKRTAAGRLRYYRALSGGSRLTQALACMEGWYSVKGLFRWFLKAGGDTDRIEERIVLFKARSFDHALDLAEQEAKKYCAPDRKANFGIEPVGWWYAYALTEHPASGTEVFSRRCITSLSAKAFVRRYYPESHRANAG